MESVVAIVLLSIVSVAITSLNGHLFLRSSDMRSLQQSTQLLQACVDQVISMRKSVKFDVSLHCNALNSLNTGYILSVVEETTSDLCPNGLQCKQVQVSVNNIGTPVSLLFVNY